MPRHHSQLASVVVALLLFVLFEPILSAPASSTVKVKKLPPAKSSKSAKKSSTASSRTSSKTTRALPTSSTKSARSTVATATKSRATTPTQGPGTASAATESTKCLGSGANDTDINLAFYYGGAGTTVNLCQGAQIKLYNAVFFTAQNQALQTIGKPSGNARATLIVSGSTLSTAVVGTCDQCSNIYLGYVIINGNRPKMGRIDASDGGGANIEFGGNTAGQVIEGIWSYEPRGWSALHAIEGSRNGVPACTGITIKNNQLGPSGNSPNQGPQFKRSLDSYRLFMRASLKVRAATGVQKPGEWADGISLSCANSVVTGNTITDATDGAIVIFNSPGSRITGNTIISRNRNTLGGVNMVDFGPWKGDYTGTVVSGNNLITDGAMIKIGIAMGTMVWGSYNNTAFRTFNGNVAGNIFSTTVNGGYFGYGIATGGMNTTRTSGNSFAAAKFGGWKSAACIPAPYAPPVPQQMIHDPYTSSGSMQQGSSSQTVVFLICLSPNNAQGSAAFTRRDTLQEPVVVHERGLPSDELGSIDRLVARSLEDDADADPYLKLLARAIADDDEDAVPAPRQTGTAPTEPPSYIPRATGVPSAGVQRRNSGSDNTIAERDMLAIDKTAFANLKQ